MRVSFSKSQSSLLASIRSGDSRAMEMIYAKYRNEFISWGKSKYKLSEDEMLDHYQDVLTIFFEKVINGTLETVESTIKTYLFGIGKNKIMQQFDRDGRKKRHEEHVSEHYSFLARNENALGIFETAKETSKRIFETIGEPCKTILRLFYFDKKSMTEIASAMGHKNEGVSRTTKKRCLEKIRSELKQSEDVG